jgi:hypothetical protein
MLYLILQLGGVGNLLAGIEIAERSESFDADRIEGKFAFWYQ